MQLQACASPEQALFLGRATLVVRAGINLLQLNGEDFPNNKAIILE